MNNIIEMDFGMDEDDIGYLVFAWMVKQITSK